MGRTAGVKHNKAYKISFSFLPNKSNGTKGIVYKRKRYYPAYVMVVFHRKSTKFPFKIGESPLKLFISDKKNFIMVDDDRQIIKEISLSEVASKFEEIQVQLVKIIKREFFTFGGKHLIRGISSRREQFLQPLLKLFEWLLLQKIQESIEGVVTVSVYKRFEKWKQQSIMLDPDQNKVQAALEYLDPLIDDDRLQDFWSDNYVLTVLRLLEGEKPFTLYGLVIESSLEKQVMNPLKESPILQQVSERASNTMIIPFREFEDRLRELVDQAFNQIYQGYNHFGKHQ